MAQKFTMREIVLDPCPFCRQPVQVVSVTNLHGYQWPQEDWQVQCVNKACPVRPRTGFLTLKANAPHRWNYRDAALARAKAEGAEGAEGAEEMREVWQLIEALRAPEGHSVTLMSDNPDFNGLPNCAVEVCGDWTDWKPVRFTGETVLAALRFASQTARALPTPKDHGGKDAE